jgi:hypothetical protein
LSLPRTLAGVYRIVREDYAPSALDEHLWAFAGFHAGSGDPHYRARTWQKASLNAIGAEDVAGMPASEFALMVHVAMEIEAPIQAYSGQTGEGFRLLLPGLGRFMGRNQAQAQHADAAGDTWCESCWCAEERRHSATFARVIARITGLAPLRDNPNDPIPVDANESDALRLLAGRESSEWNASSVYVVLAAHATDELHTVMRNVARDEIKHLAILSAVDRYLYGPRPWGRFNALVGTAIEQYRSHRQRRSAGDYIGTNAASACEVIVAHLLAEHRVRRWLASLPLGALIAVFEFPSQLPALAALPRAPEQEARDREAVHAAAERRAGLARWAPANRQRALEQRAWEADSAETIDRLMDGDLAALAGAGLSGSVEDRQTRRRIRRLGTGRLRTALLGRLRLHQIVYNRHVIARKD